MKYTDICISDYSQQVTKQDSCMSTLVRPRLFCLTSLRFLKESYGSCAIDKISLFKFVKSSTKLNLTIYGFKYNCSFHKVRRLSELVHEEDIEYLSSTCLSDTQDYKIFRRLYKV